MLDTGNMSPAMRSISGFIERQPRIKVAGVQRMTVDLDNGETLVGDAVVIHVDGTSAAEDLYLADVEGDVWSLSEAMPPAVLCSSGSQRDVAVAAFKLKVGPAALAIIC